MYFAPVSVRPVRKPHCWFSHEAAHVYFAPGLHTRETVNLYTAGAPWKEKLTVSGVGVVGSN